MLRDGHFSTPDRPDPTHRSTTQLPFFSKTALLVLFLSHFHPSQPPPTNQPNATIMTHSHHSGGSSGQMQKHRPQHVQQHHQGHPSTPRPSASASACPAAPRPSSPRPPAAAAAAPPSLEPGNTYPKIASLVRCVCAVRAPVSGRAGGARVRLDLETGAAVAAGFFWGCLFECGTAGTCDASE
ncbi:hypothetical protein IWX46DRAFT_402308 [Phyllosticta citricarpa]|uniref:Uncharacterized protein n=1 Tax=Phyllosticta citricarpa TaxID=55181 RepID=A0ABR1L766_9PEZI